jgi:hypothetical protein
MALAIILLVTAAFCAGIVTGIITIIITSIRLEDRDKTLTGSPRTPATAATRWMLGVGVRNGTAGSGEHGDERSDNRCQP